MTASNRAISRAAPGPGGSLLGRLMGYDPLTQLRIVRYALSPNGWPAEMPLRILLFTDLHACDPWMNINRIRYLCDQANALKPDIMLLLGDYVTAVAPLGSAIPPPVWAKELARLNAPFGVHAILGNHDWQEDPPAQQRKAGPVEAGQALEDNGIKVYENEAALIKTADGPFWLAGLSDQRALPRQPGLHKRQGRGLDDLEGTLEQVTSDDPVILMAHEPDIFPRVPDRVSLTVSGHTHGGQIRPFGRVMVVPSDYGTRYAYGHIREEGRDLIVSGGLGCSRLPIRFLMPPELVLLELC